MDYRSQLIQKILKHSPSICPEPFQDFTVRGEGKTKIEWNSDMLIDNGVPLDRLRDLQTLLDNQAEYRGLTR